MDALAAAHDAAVQMIDTTIVRVHQHAACVARNKAQSMGRSRGGMTSKIHVVVDTNGLPVRLGLTAGEAHDNRLVFKLLSGLRFSARRLAVGSPEFYKVEKWSWDGMPVHARARQVAEADKLDSCRLITTIGAS
jgi:hypothetical protein